MSWIPLEIKTFGMPNHLRGKPSVIVTSCLLARASIPFQVVATWPLSVGQTTTLISRTDEFSAGREGSPRLSPLVTAVAAALIAVIASHTAHRAMNAQAARASEAAKRPENASPAS